MTPKNPLIPYVLLCLIPLCGISAQNGGSAQRRSFRYLAHTEFAGPQIECMHMDSMNVLDTVDVLALNPFGELGLPIQDYCEQYGTPIYTDGTAVFRTRYNWTIAPGGLLIICYFLIEESLSGEPLGSRIQVVVIDQQARIVGQTPVWDSG